MGPHINIWGKYGNKSQKGEQKEVKLGNLGIEWRKIKRYVVKI